MSCTLPPAGWRCTRTAGHDGPCALKAEQALWRAGLGTYSPVAHFSADEYLVLCLEHHDGSAATVDEIAAASKRLGEIG